MAQNDTIYLAPNEWAEVTNADATNITFQNVGSTPVFILGTVGAVAPTSMAGAIRYFPNQGELNVVLAELFPGVVGVTRLYAWSESSGRVMASHA